MSATPLRALDFVTRLRWRWFHFKPVRHLKHAEGHISMHHREWGRVDSMLERRYLKNTCQDLVAQHVPLVARLSHHRRYLVKVKLDHHTHRAIWVGLYQWPKDYVLSHRGSIYFEGELAYFYRIEDGVVDTMPYLSSRTAVKDLTLCAQYTIALP